MCMNNLLHLSNHVAGTAEFTSAPLEVKCLWPQYHCREWSFFYLKSRHSTKVLQEKSSLISHFTLVPVHTLVSNLNTPSQGNSLSDL
jgi:hypothetical protein